MVEARPIGYVEVQTSYVGPFDRDKELEMWGETMQKVARDYKGLVVHSHRVERVPDGAGVMHNTLYIGFEPKKQTTPPLNPRNLNDADAPTIGNPVGDFFIGQKEHKF